MPRSPHGAAIDHTGPTQSGDCCLNWLQYTLTDWLNVSYHGQWVRGLNLTSSARISNVVPLSRACVPGKHLSITSLCRPTASNIWAPYRPHTHRRTTPRHTHYKSVNLLDCGITTTFEFRFQLRHIPIFTVRHSTKFAAIYLLKIPPHTTLMSENERQSQTIAVINDKLQRTIVTRLKCNGLSITIGY